MNGFQCDPPVHAGISRACCPAACVPGLSHSYIDRACTSTAAERAPIKTELRRADFAISLSDLAPSDATRIRARACTSYNSKQILSRDLPPSPVRPSTLVEFYSSFMLVIRLLSAQSNARDTFDSLCHFFVNYHYYFLFRSSYLSARNFWRNFRRRPLK